jgi:Flp pilus assembly protein TadD
VTRAGLRTLLLAATLPLAACTTAAPTGDSAWEADPERAADATTLHSTARLYAAQNRQAEAESLLRRLLSSQPDFLPAYEELARLYVRQDLLDGAARALELGLERCSTDPVLLNDLGLVRLMERDLDAAAQAFTRAAAAAPDDARPRANLALALALAGRDSEALALWEQVLPPDEARANLDLVIAQRAR